MTGIVYNAEDRLHPGSSTLLSLGGKVFFFCDLTEPCPSEPSLQQAVGRERCATQWLTAICGEDNPNLLKPAEFELDSYGLAGRVAHKLPQAFTVLQSPGLNPYPPAAIEGSMGTPCCSTAQHAEVSFGLIYAEWHVPDFS